MKPYSVIVTLKFNLESDADSMSDFEHDTLFFIEQHIMEDEETNPIEMEIRPDR